MNVNRTMLKPYTSICKDMPVYRTICARAQRQSGFHPGSLSALNAREGGRAHYSQESNFLKRTGASANSAASMSAARGAPRATFARGRTTKITTRIQGGRARLYLR